MSKDQRSDDYEEVSAYYRALLEPVFRGKRLILIGGVLVGLARLAEGLKTLGVDDVFLLASMLGTGDVPDPDDVPWHSLDVRAKSVMEEFRGYEGLLRDLPEDARRALDAFDPELRAEVVGPIVLSDVPAVYGRPRYGGRPPQWAALEDKIAIDRFWDDTGVRRAPSLVVASDLDSLERAARQLDRGAGSVWAGDAREGIHGGAEYLRWIRSGEQAREAWGFFGAHCDRVRVMPFLAGVPCSIHGIVFPNYVAVLRPVEMVTLRRPDSTRLVYAGLGTFWDPPEADRDALRALARRVGENLRERLDYRGAFTIDGVMGADGFLPTEMNPRFGAGLGAIAGAIDLPVAALDFAVIAGEDLAYRPEWLEEMVVRCADERRAGRGSLAVALEQSETETRNLVRTPQGFRLAVGEEPDDGSLSLGPHATGGFLFYRPKPESIPSGSLLAPYVVDAFALADRELKTGIGRVEPASAV